MDNLENAMVFDKGSGKKLMVGQKGCLEGSFGWEKSGGLTGDWLPDETQATIKSHLVASKGATRNPSREKGSFPLNVTLDKNWSITSATVR